MNLAYDAGSNLRALRARLRTATPAEIDRFIPICERQVLRAERCGFDDRAAYWREALTLAQIATSGKDAPE
jgi:hypothetical protein